MRKLLMLLSVVGSVFSISHSVQAAGRDLYNAGSGDGAISLLDSAGTTGSCRASPASRRDGPISPEPPVVAYCSTTPRPDSARPPRSTTPATTLLFAASPASRLDGHASSANEGSLLFYNAGTGDGAILPCSTARELPGSCRASPASRRDDPYHRNRQWWRTVLQRLDRTSARPPIDNAGNYACSQHPRLRDWMDPHHVRERGRPPLQRRNQGRCDLPARQRRELSVRAEHPRLRDGMDPYRRNRRWWRTVLQRLDRTRRDRPESTMPATTPLFAASPASRLDGPTSRDFRPLSGAPASIGDMEPRLTIPTNPIFALPGNGVPVLYKRRRSKLLRYTTAR